MTWNLRRVLYDSCSPEVFEVHYDDEGRPWAMSDASLTDKIFFVRDWLRMPVLEYPKDFTGKGPKATGIKPLKVR